MGTSLILTPSLDILAVTSGQKANPFSSRCIFLITLDQKPL